MLYEMSCDDIAASWYHRRSSNRARGVVISLMKQRSGVVSSINIAEYCERNAHDAVIFSVRMRGERLWRHWAPRDTIATRYGEMPAGWNDHEEISRRSRPRCRRRK